MYNPTPNEYVGEERRVNSHDCSQVDRLKRIEDDMQSHKSWQKETTEVLNDIRIQVASLNERLKYKMESFDDHVKTGESFRVMLIGTMLALSVSVITAVYAYGGLNKQVEVNTERWNKLLHTVAVSEIK